MIGFEQQVEGLMDFFHRSNKEVKPLPGTVHGRTFPEYVTMMSGLTPKELSARAVELGMPKNSTAEQVIVALWNQAASRRDRRGYDRPF